jgi:hypothetical protein
MTRLVLLIFIATITLVSAVTAAERNDPNDVFNVHPVILDPALRTCSKWLEHRQSGTQAEKDDVTWMFGFLSGYNAFNKPSGRPFLPQDGEHLLNMIDKGCAENPEAHIATIAVAFINELRRSAKTLETPQRDVSGNGK